MKLAQLKYFLTVIREGSYVGAASKLNLSPQALSKAVRALEDELQAPLFARTGRRIELTEFGKGFALQAQDALQQLDDLAFYAQGYASQQRMSRIQLGVVSAPFRSSICSVEDFAAYRSAHPHVRLDVAFHSSEYCLSAVRQGVLDAALVLGEFNHAGIACHRVGKLHPCAVMSSTHPLAFRASLSMADLSGQLVAFPIDTYCASTNLVRICREHNSSPLFVDLAPTFESHQQFLNSGGIILMTNDKEHAALFEGTTALSFAAEARFFAPITLVCPAHHDEDIAVLYAYLADMMQQ